MRKGQILLVGEALKRTGLEAVQNCKKKPKRLLDNCPLSMVGRSDHLVLSMVVGWIHGPRYTKNFSEELFLRKHIKNCFTDLG